MFYPPEEKTCQKLNEEKPKFNLLWKGSLYKFFFRQKRKLINYESRIFSPVVMSRRLHSSASGWRRRRFLITRN